MKKIALILALNLIGILAYSQSTEDATSLIIVQYSNTLTISYSNGVEKQFDIEAEKKKLNISAEGKAAPLLTLSPILKRVEKLKSEGWKVEQTSFETSGYSTFFYMTKD